MRVLFTVPHHYDPRSESARHGSLNPAMRESRRRALELLIFQLHSLFGRKQFAVDHVEQKLVPAAGITSFDFDLCICTTGKKHLLREIECPSSMYTHVLTSEPAEFLGFACHELMVRTLGQYDYYCYLEDDIVIYDQLFFMKLELFNDAAREIAQPGPVLQPQRYEISLGMGADRQRVLSRVYMDYRGQIAPEWYPKQTTKLDLLGHSFTVERTTHTHSGCFFLNSSQMEYLAKQPVFLDRTKIWISPLDTAATLALMECFPVFKPAIDSMGFFDVCHACPAMMQQISAGATGPQWMR